MLVAVYGTLRRGGGNHRLLQNESLVGHTSVPGFDMLQVSMSFPGVVDGDGNVVVEVWEVSKEAFARLDILEGYPNLYTRRLIPTEFGDAWIYIWNGPNNGAKIQSGDWFNKGESR